MKGKWKKGSGTTIFGVFVMLLTLSMCITLIQTFAIQQNAHAAQNAADSISDATAVYVTNEKGDYEEAVDYANQMQNLIADHTNVKTNSLHIDEDAFEEDKISVSTKLSDSYVAGIGSKVTDTRNYDINVDAVTEFTASKLEGTFPNNGMKIPFFYQNNYPDTPYGSHGTVASSGCGITSMSMVASYLLGENHMPDELALKYGRFHVSEGSSWDLFPTAAADFGLKMSETKSIAQVMQALSSGNPVISSQDPGLFTTGGHFIVLRGIENGMIYVNDPNSGNAIAKNYNTRGFTPEEINADAKNYWIFSK